MQLQQMCKYSTNIYCTEAPQVQKPSFSRAFKSSQTTVANAEGNPNNRFGFAGNHEGGKD